MVGGINCGSLVDGSFRLSPQKHPPKISICKGHSGSKVVAAHTPFALLSHIPAIEHGRDIILVKIDFENDIITKNSLLFASKK